MFVFHETGAGSGFKLSSWSARHVRFLPLFLVSYTVMSDGWLVVRWSDGIWFGLVWVRRLSSLSTCGSYLSGACSFPFSLYPLALVWFIFLVCLLWCGYLFDGSDFGSGDLVENTFSLVSTIYKNGVALDGGWVRSANTLFLLVLSILFPSCFEHST